MLVSGSVSNYNTGFGQVYDYWALGPLGDKAAHMGERVQFGRGDFVVSVKKEWRRKAA